MADLRLQRRIEEGDREALEHIARALEGRVLFGPGTNSPRLRGNELDEAPDAQEISPMAHVNGSASERPPDDTDQDLPADDEESRESGSLPTLTSHGTATLLEAMPAAIGLLQAGRLIHVNTAFAYAFGYRSPAEFMSSGGLTAILTDGASLLENADETGRTQELEALTHSRRRITAAFMLTPLDAATYTTLLRLIDQSDEEPAPSQGSADETAEAAEQRAPFSMNPASETPKPAPAESVPEDVAPEQPATKDTVPHGLVPKDTAPKDTAPKDAAPKDAAPYAVQAEDITSETATPEDVKCEDPTPKDPAPAVAQASTEPWGTSNLETSNLGTSAQRLDFLAKVSHEVRTPLNSIIGFAELMVQERFGALGNARYKEYADDIHESGLYAVSLLNDLLDISKIDAGKFELDFTAVDVGELVESCVASLQPLAKRTRVVMRTSLANDLPFIIADPRRLKQVLLNLLTNAIKFTPEGGQIFVSGTMVKGDLRIRVRDSGVGMSNDEIAFAMQPFHQLDTTPRIQSGTGLGLPLTKALVDANRATLELSSEPGIGTSADVIFPAERVFRS